MPFQQPYPNLTIQENIASMVAQGVPRRDAIVRALRAARGPVGPKEPPKPSDYKLPEEKPQRPGVNIAAPRG